MSITLTSDFIRKSVADIEAETSCLKGMRQTLAYTVLKNRGRNNVFLSADEVDRLIQAMDTSGMNSHLIDEVNKTAKAFRETKRTEHVSVLDKTFTFTYLGDDIHSFDDKPAITDGQTFVWCNKGKIERHGGMPCYIDTTGRVLCSTTASKFPQKVKVGGHVLSCVIGSRMGDFSDIIEPMMTTDTPSLFKHSRRTYAPPTPKRKFMGRPTEMKTPESPTSVKLKRMFDQRQNSSLF